MNNESSDPVCRAGISLGAAEGARCQPLAVCIGGAFCAGTAVGRACGAAKISAGAQKLWLCICREPAGFARPRRAAACAVTTLDADLCRAHRADASVRGFTVLLCHPWCRLCQHCCPAGAFPRCTADRVAVPLYAHGLCHDGGAEHPYRGTV